jgi:hypothetical protein
MSGHDLLCPLRKLTVLKSGCPQCDLIRAGRIDGVRQALARVDSGGRAAVQLRALLDELDPQDGAE